MERKGQGKAFDVIVAAVFAVLLIAVIAYLTLKPAGVLNAGLYCPVDKDGNQNKASSEAPDNYMCTGSIAKGCPEGYGFFWSIFGCRNCCVKEEEASAPDPGSLPTLVVRAYELTAPQGTNAEITDFTPLSGSVRMLANVPKTIMFEMEAINCKEPCSPDSLSWSFSLKNKAGEEILLNTPSVDRVVVADRKTILAVRPLTGSELNAMKPVQGVREGEESIFADRNFRFSFPDQLTGETLTLSARIGYEYKDKDQPKRVEDALELQLTVTPPVSYRPFAQQWSRSKIIEAECNSPVECVGIYYRILRIEEKEGKAVSLPSCPLPSSDDMENAVVLGTDVTQHCMYGPDGLQEACYKDLNSCVTNGLQSVKDPRLSVGLDSLKKKLAEPGVSEDVLLPVITSLSGFMDSAEGTIGAYACLRDLPVDSGYDRFFAAEQIRPSRWRFTLDLPSLQPFEGKGQYLCVYGETTGGNVRVAGEPKRIMIDRLPPAARVTFESKTRSIIPLCSDTGSGCDGEKTRMTYLGSGAQGDQVLSAFIQAFLKETPQKAVELCPNYASGQGYTIVPDTYDLGGAHIGCVRFVDYAGNPTVAMKTFYDTRPLIVNAIVLAVEKLR